MQIEMKNIEININAQRLLQWKHTANNDFTIKYN